MSIADDPAEVTVTANDPDASEVGLDSGEVTFTRIGGNLDAALIVTFSRVGSSAVLNQDDTVTPANATGSFYKKT